jgi:hypothetical protein
VLMVAAGAGVTKETIQLLLDNGAAPWGETDWVAHLRFNLEL